MRKLCTLVVVAMFVFIGVARAAWAGGPLDFRIPPDALVYVGWQGANDLAGDYAQSNLKGILDNSKLPQYLVENWPTWMGQLKDSDEDAAERFQQASVGLEMLWRHTCALYVGPVSLANPAKPNVKFAVLCDAGEDAEKLETWAKEWIAKVPPSEDFKPVVYRNGTLVIFTETDVKPEDFFRNDGGLAASPAYKAANASLMKDRMAGVYIDAQKILVTIEEAVRVNPDAPEEAKKGVPAMFKALGLGSLTQIAGGATMDGKEWVEQVFIGSKAPRSGVLALLFDVQPISDDAIKMVPKDAAAMNLGRFDLAKGMALVREVVSQVAPESMPNLDNALAMAKETTGVDIEKELLATFGDEWVTYRGPLTESASYPFVLVNKLREAAALTKALEALGTKVNEMAGGRVQVEKMDTGTFEVTGIRLPQITIAWTIRDGIFYVSSLEGISSAVEQVEKKGESILANANYVKVRGALPVHKAISITYSEPAKLYSEAYRGLMGLLPLGRMAGLDLPADLLPLPKKVAGFMTPGGSISWLDADGLHVSSRCAFPGAEILGQQASPPTLLGATAVGAGAAFFSARLTVVPAH
ncbi:MAG: hypothetical protein FWD61_10405 [Phycisphaerales bacterium]|nr:hypothetical protein [Phycisphaerales bacterium]